MGDTSMGLAALFPIPTQLQRQYWVMREEIEQPNKGVGQDSSDAHQSATSKRGVPHKTEIHRNSCEVQLQTQDDFRQEMFRGMSAPRCCRPCGAWCAPLGGIR